MRKFRYSGIKTGIKILGVYFFRNRKKRSKKRWKMMVVDSESGNAKTGNHDAAVSKRAVNNEEELGAQ